MLQDTKKAMRLITDQVTRIKEIYTQAQNVKYGAGLHEDTQPIIKQLASIYKTIEAIHLANDNLTDQETWLAIAMKYGKLKQEYDECGVWANRLLKKEKVV